MTLKQRGRQESTVLLRTAQLAITFLLSMQQWAICNVRLEVGESNYCCFFPLTCFEPRLTLTATLDASWSRRLNKLSQLVASRWTIDTKAAHLLLDEQ